MFETQPIRQEIKIAGFNSIYYFEFGKDFTHTPERHNFWEMVYVDNGRINAITNGIGCTLEQGQVIFHEPMEIHAHVSDRQVANNMLVISFTTNSKVMQYLKAKPLRLIKPQKHYSPCFLKKQKTPLAGCRAIMRIKIIFAFCPRSLGPRSFCNVILPNF